MAVESPRVGGFLASEAPGTRSRDQISMLALNDGATTYQAGTPVAQLLTTGVAAFANGASNTGNGTCGTITTTQGVVPGVYVAECLVAGATAVFSLESPSGVFIGNFKVGTAFAGGGLAFTITTGGTNYAVGDIITFTLPSSGGNVGEYVAWNHATGKYGAETIAGILFAPTYVGGASNVNALIISRAAEVKGDLIQWPATDGGTIAAGTAQLATLGIEIRAGVP